MTKPSYFAKSESSISFTDGALGNYTGVGIRQPFSFGTLEGMAAAKFSETSKGGFGEIKYTSPKVLPDTSIENRTRFQFETSGNTMTNRVALKYSKSLNDKFSIYEIAGATAKVSLDGEGLKSITPVSLTGVGYNINKNLSCYAEGEVSKSYNTQTHTWGKVSPAAYVGVKYTF